jgi:hypothetical protein
MFIELVEASLNVGQLCETIFFNQTKQNTSTNPFYVIMPKGTVIGIKGKRGWAVTKRAVPKRTGKIVSIINNTTTIREERIFDTISYTRVKTCKPTSRTLLLL